MVKWPKDYQIKYVTNKIPEEFERDIFITSSCLDLNSMEKKYTLDMPLKECCEI